VVSAPCAAGLCVEAGAPHLPAVVRRTGSASAQARLEPPKPADVPDRRTAMTGGYVARLADSRYAAPTAEHTGPTGRKLAYETTSPAGTGRLTLQYRADVRFGAVVVDDPGLLSGRS
jgi:hypothetical protein